MTCVVGVRLYSMWHVCSILPYCTAVTVVCCKQAIVQVLSSSTYASQLILDACKCKMTLEYITLPCVLSSDRTEDELVQEYL